MGLPTLPPSTTVVCGCHLQLQTVLRFRRGRVYRGLHTAAATPHTRFYRPTLPRCLHMPVVITRRLHAHHNLFRSHLHTGLRQLRTSFRNNTLHLPLRRYWFTWFTRTICHFHTLDPGLPVGGYLRLPGFTPLPAGLTLVYPHPDYIALVGYYQPYLPFCLPVVGTFGSLTFERFYQAGPRMMAPPGRRHATTAARRYTTPRPTIRSLERPSGWNAGRILPYSLPHRPHYSPQQDVAVRTRAPSRDVGLRADVMT